MVLNNKCKLLRTNPPLFPSLNYCIMYMSPLRHSVGQINEGLKNLATYLGLREGKSLSFKDKLTNTSKSIFYGDNNPCFVSRFVYKSFHSKRTVILIWQFSFLD